MESGVCRALLLHTFHSHKCWKVSGKTWMGWDIKCWGTKIMPSFSFGSAWFLTGVGWKPCYFFHQFAPGSMFRFCTKLKLLYCSLHHNTELLWFSCDVMWYYTKNMCPWKIALLTWGQKIGFSQQIQKLANVCPNLNRRLRPNELSNEVDLY